MKLGDYLKAINDTKQSLFDDAVSDPSIASEYVPFIINRSLSYFPDTIFQANEINQRSQVDKKMQFDYLRYSVRQRKRFSRWTKKRRNDHLNLIKQYYGYSNRRAEEVLGILSKEDFDFITKQMNTGGAKRKK